MMAEKKVRVRFAPAPTGRMHIGNVRIAVLNYLFAKKFNGDFVLRFEDTDEERNVAEISYAIEKELKWLGLEYNEGGELGGAYGPYFQSERKKVYARTLDDLVAEDAVYRCFCSEHELEVMREEQIKRGEPPHYNGKCRNLSDEKIKSHLAFGMKFVWRFKLDHESVSEIDDLVRGKIKIDLKYVSDPILMRRDGSFTFIFANAVDDALMEITHVIRGEDHLTNTAVQEKIIEAIGEQPPIYWHIPLMLGPSGKKLSKRDFGFALVDLMTKGALPEAIVNYVATLGAKDVEKEIMGMEELIEWFDPKHYASTSQPKFDIEKMAWFNRRWIQRLDPSEFADRAMAFLRGHYQWTSAYTDSQLRKLVSPYQEDISWLSELDKMLEYTHKDPEVDIDFAKDWIGKNFDAVVKILLPLSEEFVSADSDISKLREKAAAAGVAVGDVFSMLRYAITGSFSGAPIHDLLDSLPPEQVRKRIRKLAKATG